jgi:hypothetical protein
VEASTVAECASAEVKCCYELELFRVIRFGFGRTERCVLVGCFQVMSYLRFVGFVRMML